MGDSKAFGAYLRNLRKAKRIRSAAALARKARLALSHISTIERGEFHPRLETAKKIAKALSITSEEYAEFWAQWDAARKPREVLDTQGPPLAAGISLWRHLPGVLFQIPHFCGPSLAIYPDIFFPEFIRACGALLAWLELKGNPPTAKMLARLRNRASDCVATIQNAQGPNAEAWRTKKEAALAVPHVWRAEIFGTAKSSTKIAQYVHRWDFFPPMWDRGPNEIHIRLADPVLHRKWGVQGVDPNAVADLHDAMIMHDLWGNLGLRESLGPPTENPYLSRCSLGNDLRELMKCDPASLRKRCYSSPTQPQIDADFAAKCLDMLARAHFALRVLDTPDLARRLVDEEFSYTADEVQAKIITVASTLEIEPKEAYSIFYDPLPSDPSETGTKD